MLRWPVEPMRAAAAPDLPTGAVAGTLVFEPKWDGFRALAWIDADGVRLQSRQGKSLTAYFPDVCNALERHLPPRVVLDGELISWDDHTGRTSFDHLQRRFTAGRGITREAMANPAHYVVFDLLRDGRGRELLDQPFATRRRRLARLLTGAPPQLQLCPQTSDERAARRWFTDWAGAGVEGLVVKHADQPYRPAHAGWVKVKKKQTAEFVIGGVTGTRARPVALLLGRFDERGVLRYLGQTHPLAAVEARRLAQLLRPMVFQGAGAGHPWPCPLPAGWSIDMAEPKPLAYVPVEPLLVAEVEVDAAVDGPYGRQRHRVKHVRLRPDLHPADVTRTGRLVPQ